MSFGLKPYARQVLNSVFLSEAILNGLDAAIVSPAKIVPLAKLKPADVELARDLIYDRRSPGYDPLFKFVERFGGESREHLGAEGETARWKSDCRGASLTAKSRHRQAAGRSAKRRTQAAWDHQ